MGRWRNIFTESMKQLILSLFDTHSRLMLCLFSIGVRSRSDDGVQHCVMSFSTKGDLLMSFDLLLQFDWIVLLVLGLAAIVTSIIHGATGVAGGMLMAAVLASVIGVKPVIPVMSVALLISHSARALINIKNFDSSIFFLVSISSFPMLILVASFYGRFTASWIAILLGTLLLISVPMRYWSAKRQMLVSKGGLASAAACYGALSGASIGPGMVLSPFMLSYGMKREAFVATMAVIALTTNILRVGVFGGSDQLMEGYLALGLFIGLLTIPGNWMGRSVLRRMSNQSHSRAVDVLSILAALNFYYLAMG